MNVPANNPMARQKQISPARSPAKVLEDVAGCCILVGTKFEEDLMPFCPKCRVEYVDGVESCDDCGVALVAALPQALEGSGREKDLVEVWRTQGEVEAQLIASLLESEGVKSMFSGESLRLTHGLTVDGLALVKILVRSEDTKLACDVIAATEGVEKCAHCGFPVSVNDAKCWACGESRESQP